MREGQRKLLSTLWNTYAFYVLYAEIDQFDPNQYEWKMDTLSVMDKWLLSKLNTMVRNIDTNLENYRIPEAARALQEFVDDMSNWYVRRSRQRFWGKELTQDKINAYKTLYTALVTTAKAAAPMIPFMAEEIYQNLVRNLDKTAPESVHLCDFPVCDESLIDEELERQMEQVLEIVALGRAARNEANLKIRQPLAKMYVRAEFVSDPMFQTIMTEELNVKSMEFVSDASSFTNYTFKPQLKLLGRKFGKQINEVRTALAALDGAKSKKELDETGKLTLTLSTGETSLTEEELLIETSQMEGFASITDRGVTVVLDTRLTPELIEEGFVREIISKIQSMRRDADFDVTDHIAVTMEGSEKVCEIAQKYVDAISRDVLADSLTVGKAEGVVSQWDINGEDAVFGVAKISK